MPGVVCCGGGAPGRGKVSGDVGVCCGGIVPGLGGIPGNWPLTGLPWGNWPFTGLPCGGITTLIGSSLSSIGCGGRWKGAGTELLTVAAGARLVGMMVTRSKMAAFAIGTRRGAAM
jgi:hypothetical protein